MKSAVTDRSLLESAGEDPAQGGASAEAAAIVARVPKTTDYEELFREKAPSLWRAMYVFTGGRRELAEEAVAEAFASAIGSADHIRNPLAWIYRTAFRFASREMKREQRVLPHLEAPEEDEFEDLYDLLEALGRLAPRQRAALVLHYRNDLPIREIAGILGVSAATVRVHLHRGRLKLKNLLEEGG